MTDQQPIELVGSFQGRSVPKELYGMLTAALLRGTEMGRDIMEELSYLNFHLPRGPFRVVLFSLDDPRVRELSGRERHNCRLKIYDALRSQMMSCLKDTDGVLVLIMGYLIGILYPQSSEDNIVEASRESVWNVEKQLGYGAHVTISSRWETPDKLEMAYRMIQDIEGGRSFYGSLIDRVFEIPSDALARISDGDKKTQFEQNFFGTTERVCGAVRAGDGEAAGRYIREQLRQIAENSIGMPYPTTLNLTINRFMSLLQYRLADESLADWRYMAQQDFSRLLVSCGSMEAYLKTGTWIAENLVEHASVRSQKQYDSFMHEVYDYIEGNATDVNMGLTAVARAFRLKPREAAESFRKYFGESINDVIHKARVKKAKELLLTTDDSVQDIAEAVGYCSLATMYRAFTNVEGVAPGKLRQKNPQKTDAL
jgi:AraC-like DNA-binding protein